MLLFSKLIVFFFKSIPDKIKTQTLQLDINTIYNSLYHNNINKRLKINSDWYNSKDSGMNNIRSIYIVSYHIYKQLSTQIYILNKNNWSGTTIEYLYITF